MSDEAMLDELDEAFHDVYPGRGRVWVGPPLLLHDDEDQGLTWIRGTSTVHHLPQWRTDLPNPFAVLAEGSTTAANAELTRFLEAGSAAVAEAARRLAPVFEAMIANVSEISRQAQAVGLIPPPPVDPREEILAAKRAPGRTGPPAPPLDGRRSR